MHSIFIQFDGKGKVALEKFRDKYDSLSEKIEAHITVLFPNKILEITDMIEAVQSLSCEGNKSFSLSNFIVYDGDVGYLEVEARAEEFLEIYRELSNVLKISSHRKYVPHVTVVRDSARLPKLVDLPCYNFLVAGIVIEKIEVNGNSSVVYKQKM